MATYAIGDVQGCAEEFFALLARIDFQVGRDTLYLVGDLVNRGPGSLDVLRWSYQHRACTHIVLGNHDLHLLAVHEGVSKARRNDTLDVILAAPDAAALMDWLRLQPLVRQAGRYVFVHAGLPPQWSVDEALRLSEEVGQVLQSADYKALLQHMYGNEPHRWADTLTGWDRLRFIINACTRMRIVDTDGTLDVAFKGELADAPMGKLAWFDAPRERALEHVIVTGHWSALGLLVREDVIALDTGCVWGGSLTAVRLDDGQIFQEPSRQPVCTDWN